MTKYLLIFALLLPRILLAQEDVLPALGDKQIKLLDRLETLDLQGQRKLDAKRLAPIRDMGEGKANKVQAAIIQGAVLTNDQGVSYYTKKYLYVWGIIRENNPYVFYVLDTKGEVVFTTHTRFIVPIKSDLAMNPTPQEFHEVVHIPNRFTYNEKFKFELAPFYGAESMRFASAQSYLEEDGGQTIAQRFGINLLFPLNLPIKPGLFISFQNGMKSAEQMSYSYSSLDVGPLLKIALGKSNSLTLSGGKSLFFRGNFKRADGNEIQGSFDSTFGGLSLGHLFQTALGPIELEASYKLYTLNANESTTAISAESRHQQNSVIGLTITRGWEFSL